MITGVIIETDIIGSDILKDSDLETQSSMPDVPYEPDLDIEIDFPRGIKVLFYSFNMNLWLWNLVNGVIIVVMIIRHLVFMSLHLLLIFVFYFLPK